MVRQPHPRSVSPLDFALRRGRAPGRSSHFDKVQRRQQQGGRGSSLPPTAPSERLRPQAQLFGDAGEGHHMREGDGLCPQRLGNAASRRGPARSPLGKLLRQVLECAFCVGKGQRSHRNLPSFEKW
jgi:hypothetical protein